MGTAPATHPTGLSAARGFYNAAWTAVCVLLAVFWLCFLYCALVRLMYPFELEWLEGELLCHVIRLMDGEPVYAAPSTELVAELYPPVYYVVVAAAARLLGVSFFSQRLVSLAACAGIIAVIYRIVRSQGAGAAAAFVSCSMFVSFYHLHGPWYDVGRVDMVFFLLLLGGCLAVGNYSSRSRWLPAAVGFFVLACFTKQSALVYVPFAGLYLLSVDRKKAFVFTAATLGAVVAVFLVLTAVTDGWFAVYTLLNPLRYSDSVASSMPNLYYDLIMDIKSKLPAEIRYEICYRLPIFFSLLLAFVVCSLVTRRKPSDYSVWEYTAGAAVVSYCMIRPNVGSEKNDFMYLTIWGAVLLGMLLGRVQALRSVRLRCVAGSVLYGLLAVQLALQLYDPKSVIPAPGSTEAGNRFMEMVRELPGEVYIPYHSMYAVMAGKDMIFNAGAFWGYQILSPEGFVPNDLIAKISNHHFAAIIIDDTSYYTHMEKRYAFKNVDLLLESDEPLSRAIERHYYPARRIDYQGEDVFRNPTGFMTRPEIVLLPKDPHAER